MQPPQQEPQQEQEQEPQNPPAVIHYNDASPLYENVIDIFTEAEFASFVILMQSRGLGLQEMTQICTNLRLNLNADMAAIEDHFMENPRYRARVTLEGLDQYQNIGGPENQQMDDEKVALETQRLAEIKANAIAEITALPPIQAQVAGRRNRNRRRSTRRSRNNRRSTRRRFCRR